MLWDLNRLWVGGHRAQRLQRVARRAKIVTHTQMTVLQPWSTKLEETWELPEGAVAGSLLRDEKGVYLAVLEWRSELARDAWLAGQPGLPQDLEKHTMKYYERAACKRSVGSEGSDADASEFQQKLQQMQQAALARSSDRPPEVDPAVLFAISAGEDVDIDLEDEVLISGGDPSFLDDQRLSSKRNVKILQVDTMVYTVYDNIHQYHQYTTYIYVS